MTEITQQTAPATSDPVALAAQLVAAVDPENAAAPRLTILPPLSAEAADQVAARLKALADEARQSNLAQAQRIIEVLFAFATATGNPFHRALALRAQGNVLGIGQSKYREAIAVYDEAAQIYLEHERYVEWAQSQIGKVSALASLAHYAEALMVGEQTQAVLETHGQWFFAAHVASNLATDIYTVREEDRQALTKLNQALALYQRSGVENAYTLATIEENRAVVLSCLGHFSESLNANHTAWQNLMILGYTIEAARVQQNIGETLILLGRYNEALTSIEQALQIFRADKRPRDIADAERLMSGCLLHMRRYQAVLALCQQSRQTYVEIGARLDLAMTNLHVASAYVGLKNYAPAITVLHEARQIFVNLDLPVWVAHAELYEAALCYRQRLYRQSLTLAQQVAQLMRESAHPIEEAQAQLQAAHAALAMQRPTLVHDLVNAALATAYRLDLPQLLYEGHYVQGKLAQQRGQMEQALSAYTQAIQNLERLQAHLMVEFRADFSADKGVVYQEIVRLNLAQAQPTQALEFVERAKSRALLDMLAHGLDLRIQAKDAADQHLIEALQHLRAEQNRLYCRWEGRKVGKSEPQAVTQQGSTPPEQDWQPLWQEIRVLEQEIAALWNRLLMRNADYGRDAALWQVHVEAFQSDLPTDTLLLEYFVIENELVLFGVTHQSIQTQILTENLVSVESLLRFLQLNLNLVAAGNMAATGDLLAEAQDLLTELYTCLLSPVADLLTHYAHLIIVPHGSLHNLPFHALYNGAAYLIERHTISYLPSASLLHYCQRSERPRSTASHADNNTMVAFGHNWAGKLPAAPAEAEAIASLLGGVAYTGATATLEQFQAVAPTVDLLHLATHGEFRADDPLYSYLLLENGRLTTLDIFNIRLRATLVTLSACNSGQSLVGGGDELLGLLRAFLYAGTASVVVSHWRVEDAATRGLMEIFYTRLVAGESKATALASAQRQWLAGQQATVHPYFWASFFLVGNAGNPISEK